MSRKKLLIWSQKCLFLIAIIFALRNVLCFYFEFHRINCHGFQKRKQRTLSQFKSFVTRERLDIIMRDLLGPLYGKLFIIGRTNLSFINENKPLEYLNCFGCFWYMFPSVPLAVVIFLRSSDPWVHKPRFGACFPF